MSQIATIDYYQVYKQESYPADTSIKAQVEQALDAATSFITKHINRDLFSGSKAEIFTGTGYNDVLDLVHNTYAPTNAPIVGTPTLEYESNSVWKAITTHWSVAEDNKSIYRTADKYFEVDYLYKLTYNYDSCIKDDLKWAGCVVADTFLQIAQRNGMVKEQIGDVVSTFSLEIPDRAMEIIKGYNR